MDRSIIDNLANAARQVYDDTRPVGSTIDFGISRRPLNRDNLGKMLAVYDYATAQDTNAAMDTEPAGPDQTMKLTILGEAARNLAGAVKIAAARDDIDVPPYITALIEKVETLYFEATR